MRNPEDFRLEVQKVDEGQLGSVMYHSGYKAGWMVSWFCVRNPGQKGAPHKYPGDLLDKTLTGRADTAGLG